MAHLLTLVLILGVLLAAPSSAMAYVDPGILSALYQALYVAVFGFAAAFIFRPWQYLKSRFKKSGPEAQPASDKDSDKEC